MRSYSGVFAVLVTLLLVTPVLASRGATPGEKVPGHHDLATALLKSSANEADAVGATGAGWSSRTDVVSWVIGGKRGWWYAPRRCQMLVSGRWEEGEVVDWDGAWRAFAWYGVRSGAWYRQAAQFYVNGRYKWYYSNVWVGYPDPWGWYVTEDWVVRL